LSKVKIEFKNVYKKYGELTALNNVDLQIYEGEIFGIVGQSGAGKSTLLRTINRLENIESGEVLVDGENVIDFDSKKLREFRKNCGMIFQHFSLMETKNVYKNIACPCFYEFALQQQSDDGSEAHLNDQRNDTIKGIVSDHDPKCLIFEEPNIVVKSYKGHPLRVRRKSEKAVHAVRDYRYINKNQNHKEPGKHIQVGGSFFRSHVALLIIQQPQQHMLRLVLK
jgi:ABC-type sugar transport system ATPase subunit